MAPISDGDDRIYSGRYYIFRTKTDHLMVLFRQLKQRQYLVCLLGLVLINIIVVFLLDVLIIRTNFGGYKLLGFFYVFQAISIVLCLGFSLMAIIKIISLYFGKSVQKKYLSEPWVIGEVKEGYLLQNMDSEEDIPDFYHFSSTVMEELNHDVIFIGAVNTILKNGNRKCLLAALEDPASLPLLAAVLELAKEQYDIGNIDFLESSNPFDFYVKIKHY